MSPIGAIFVPFPPKTGTILLHPRPSPQSLNGSLNYPTFIQQKDSSTILEMVKEYRRIHQIGTELEQLPKQLC